MSRRSDIGIFNRAGASSILTLVFADTLSGACPAHPGSLTIITSTTTYSNHLGY